MKKIVVRSLIVATIAVMSFFLAVKSGNNNAQDTLLSSLKVIPSAQAEIGPGTCDAWCYYTGYVCVLKTNAGFNIYCYGWDEPF